MKRCPHCSRDIREDARVCKHCGRPLPAATTDPSGPTRPDPALPAGDAKELTPTATPGAATAAAIDETFAPGTELLGRYRIVGLLGKGGMGSVYRAEDRVLGQDVALKFIAQRLADDEACIQVLVNEVRLARRVTHPNVCRVHDLGEIDGRTFISMEYIDGEDLASLLRRIGRLTGDKAAQIARQLCAGLHAAHEQGVLHRDLKPQNVMIDGHGNVRIADFGIAGAAETLSDGEGTAGTPAYMAPELFTGTSPSVQSDVYALGLVLYELYTGRQLFRAESMTQLLRQHRQPVTPPSAVTPDVDSDVERVILHCLDKEPERRPPSAFAVLAALPGGDPLAEALASGQTPSPELVAQSGGTGRLSPRAAALLVVLFVAQLVLLLWLEPQIKLLARAPLPKSAAVLADRAAEMIDALYRPGDARDDAVPDSVDAGLLPSPAERARPVRRAYGFEVDRAYLQEIDAHDATAEEWNARLRSPRPPVVGFWYRQVQAPGTLIPHNIKGRVTWDDPPATQPGVVQVRLDPAGRLRELLAVPTAAGQPPPFDADAPASTDAPTDARADVRADGVDPDWAALFALAGLDPGAFERVGPVRVPTTFADWRGAWRSRDAATGARVRVSAAAWQGRPVAFSVTDERWPGDPAATAGTAHGHGPTWRLWARSLLVLGAIGLAWHSLRRRRGDFKGALRVWVVMFVGVVAFTLFTGDHHASLGGFATLLTKGMIHGLTVATEFALYYYALEPHVRRIWPETLISWSRLLRGRVRDPLVGHHLLVGAVYGLAGAVVLQLQYVIPRLRGECEPTPLMIHPSTIEVLMGPGHSVGALLELGVDSAREGMKFFMALVLLKLVLRRPVLTAASSAVLWASVWNDGPVFLSGFPFLSISWLLNIALAGVITLVAIRFGLLSLTVAFTVFLLLVSFPAIVDLSVWYSGATLLVLAVVGGLSAFGAWTATRAATSPAR